MGWNRNKGLIILYFPPVSWQLNVDKGYHRFPYSLWSLVPGLMAEGFDVKVFDGRIDDKNAFLDAVKASPSPLLVGISSLTGAQLLDAMKTAKQVREINKEIPIVWGGWHVTLNPAESIKEEFVDTIIMRRGETEIVTLANELIRGVDRRKTIICDPILAETFPKIPFDLVDINKYGPYFGYLTSTGCKWHCSFCAIQQVYKGKMFFKNMDQVIKELKYIVDNYRGLRQINIDDDLFFIKKDRVEEFCDRWNNYGGIPMSVLAHVNVLLKYDDNLWKKIIKTGFHHILIGAESGNQTILNRLKKHQTPDTMLQFVEKTRQFRITPELSTMTGFIDSCELQDFKDTILFLKKAGEINPRTAYKLFWSRPYPGTELFEQVKAAEYKMPSTMREWANYTLRYCPPWVDRELEDQVNYFVYTFQPRVGWNYDWDSFIKSFEDARSRGPISGPTGL